MSGDGMGPDGSVTKMYQVSAKALAQVLQQQDCSHSQSRHMFEPPDHTRNLSHRCIARSQPQVRPQALITILAGKCAVTDRQL